MISCGAFRVPRGLLLGGRALLGRVSFEAGGGGPRGQSRLLQFKTAVRIVTIAAAHHSFQDLMMEWRGELRFDFTMATDAELRIVRLQHSDRRKAGLLSIRASHQRIRSGQVLSDLFRVRGMTVSTTDVVAPVLAATEVVAFFFAGVTAEAGFSGFF